MPSRYTFTTYSPEWPREFAREAERLQALLGEEIITIHHIGSTSVPGLEAKPIIDLMPLVHDITRIDGYTDAMTAAGYTAWGEHGLPGRRYFTKDAGEVRTHNAHIYGVDNPEVVRHLAFCTYLRAHPDACTEYVAINAPPMPNTRQISKPTTITRMRGSSAWKEWQLLGIRNNSRTQVCLCMKSR